MTAVRRLVLLLSVLSSLAFSGQAMAAEVLSQDNEGRTIHFDVDPTRKENLLNGLDEIGLTLTHSDDIKAYEEKRKKTEPWIFQ